MESMYQHLMDGRTTVAQALRLAMLHLLRHPLSPRWRRPKYWAGFLVVGATTRLQCTTSVEGRIEAVTKKLKELGLKMGPRIKLQSRIKGLQAQAPFATSDKSRHQVQTPVAKKPRLEISPGSQTGGIQLEQ
jgi:hypothetical protein